MTLDVKQKKPKLIKSNDDDINIKYYQAYYTLRDIIDYFKFIDLNDLENILKLNSINPKNKSSLTTLLKVAKDLIREIEI